MRLAGLSLVLLGCTTDSLAGSTVLAGATVVGVGITDVRMEDGRITAVGADLTADAVVDVSGQFIVPSVIDAHVHLAYWDVADDLPAGGLAAVVDLASPMAFLDVDTTLPMVRSGPMVTAEGGYPTRSWGANGYGLEVNSVAQAQDAVDTLIANGAGVIKAPITSGPSHQTEVLLAIVERAHTANILVVSHAVDQSEAAIAAAAGVDVLAHTPITTLGDAISDWSDRAVISSLAAFGNSPTTRDNLLALHQAGATVLYGTDMGNQRVAGVNVRELQAMRDAGLTNAEVLTAATSAPAMLFGFNDHGTIEAGKVASLLVLDDDPLLDVTALARPSQIWFNGQLVTH